MKIKAGTALLLAALAGAAAAAPSPGGPGTVWDRIMLEQSAVNLRRGYARMQAEEYAAAADEFFLAAQKDPSSPWPRLLYGSALYWLGSPDKAMDEFDAALKLDPANATGYQLRGITRARAGEYRAALADFLEAERLDRARSDVKMNAGSVYQALGDPGKALDYFRAAAAGEPSNPLYRYQLGMLYSRLGRYDQAAAQLEKALSLLPSYEDAALELAVLRERDGRLPDAIKLYRKAVSLKPGDSVARFRLAWALRKAGRAAEEPGVLGPAFTLAPANDKGGISMALAYAGGQGGGGGGGSKSPLASALEKLPADRDARVTVELLETPKAALAAAPASGEKLGGKLSSLFNRPRVNYVKREYFLPAGKPAERASRAAGIAAEADKLLKGVSPGSDARLNFNIETGAPRSGADGGEKKAAYKPRDVGNDMGLWVMGDGWLDNVYEAMDEMDGSDPLAEGLGHLLLGEHSDALESFSGGGSLAALGRCAALVEAGDETGALKECREALRLDPSGPTAAANVKWLGGGKP